MREVCELLKQCSTYYLATADSDQPRMCPFGTAEIFGGKLYVQTGKVGDVYCQMRGDPKIEVNGMAGGSWIHLTATAVEDDHIQARQHMLDVYPSLKEIYNADDGSMVVFYLENVVATVCSFTEEPKMIRF